MSLTRKLLESMGLEADKVSTIIDAHIETVDAIKAERDSFKADASKLSDVQKALDSANAELEAVKSTGGDWQKKFEAEHADFEAFKTAQSEKDAKIAKENAYKALLRENGISEKRIDSVMKVSNLDTIELVEGKIKDVDKVSEAIKTEWSDFITSTQTVGANTPQPPANAGSIHYTKEDISKMSRDEINKNWSAISASLSN